MNIYILFSLVGFLVCFVLGVYVYSLNQRHKTNRSFALLALSVSIWSFGEMMMRTVESAGAAVIWDKIASAFGWCFLGPLFLNFILNFTGKEKILKNKAILFLVYAPSFLWAYLKINTDLIHSGVIKRYWGWDVIVAPGFIFYTIHLLLLFLIGFSLLIIIWRTTKNKILKNQVRLTLLGTSIPFLIGITVDALLPIFNINLIRISGLVSVIFVSFFAYALSRYQFMRISPERAASKIIATMPDPLLLVDSDLIIFLANPAMLSLLNCRESELIGQPISLLFNLENNPFTGETLESLLNKGDINTFDAEINTKSGEKVPVLTSYSTIRSFTREPIGLVVVAKDIREKRDLIQKLKESENQLRERRDRLDAILSNMLEGIIIEDQDHEIKYMNDSALTLLGNQIGKKCYETLLGGNDENPACAAGPVIRDGQKKFWTVIQGRKEMFFELIGSPLQNPDGSTYVLEIIRDFTDKKKTDDTLKAKLAELEEINDLAVGRELKMIELENEINRQRERLGEAK